MDCDRFEATLIDELYDELDELTSAAAKRHVAGCSRCASLIGGLRATRRVAVLPLVEPSVDLEDRILAAARSAQQVIPIGRRASRALSWAGSWAMRPQTAMAAVFLLMVGSSLLFVRRSKRVALDASSGMTVTAQGEPAPAPQASAAPADEQTSLDSKLAAAAHGAGPSNAAAASPPPALPSPTSTAAAPGASGYAYGNEGALAYEDMLKDKEHALPSRSATGASSGGGGPSSVDGLIASNAAAPAGAPAPKYAQRAVGRVKAAGLDDAVVPSDLDKGDSRGQSAGEWAQTETRRVADPATALQAARVSRDSSGCGVAASAFDQVAQQSPPGSAVGHQATLDAANCYRALGQTDQALARYRSLIGVKELEPQATAAIAAIQSSQGAVAAKARKAAPPAKPSAVTSTPVQAQAPAQAAPTAPAAPPPQQAPAADQVPTQQRSY